MFTRSFFTLLVVYSLLASSPINAQFSDEDEMMDPYAAYGDGMGGMGDMMDPYGMMGGMGGMPGMGGMDPYGMGGGDPYGGGGGQQEPPPQPTEFERQEDIDAFLSSEGASDAVVVGYFPVDYETRAKEDFDSFMQVATEEGRAFKFAFTTDDDIYKAKKYENPVVMVHLPAREVQEKYERSKARYPGKTIKADALKRFVAEKSLSLVGELSMTSAERYTKPEMPILTLFFSVDYAKNPSGIKYAVNRVVKLAKENKGKMLFTIANTETFARSMNEQYEFEDLDAAPKSAIHVGIKNANTYYKMEESFSKENVAKFVEAFNAGSLVGKEHKQEEPQQQMDEEMDDNAPSDVVALTNDNVDAELLKSDADVMVEFYAPWCGHCKQLKPTYSKLASKFADDAGVTIAAMDATAHEVPAGFNVEGYPTLFFLPANKKGSPMAYEGGRDEASMIKFINKHRSTAKP